MMYPQAPSDTMLGRSWLAVAMHTGAGLLGSVGHAPAFPPSMTSVTIMPEKTHIPFIGHLLCSGDLGLGSMSSGLREPCGSSARIGKRRTTRNRTGARGQLAAIVKRLGKVGGSNPPGRQLTRVPARAPARHTPHATPGMVARCL